MLHVFCLPCYVIIPFSCTLEVRSFQPVVCEHWRFAAGCQWSVNKPQKYFWIYGYTR